MKAKGSVGNTGVVNKYIIDKYDTVMHFRPPVCTFKYYIIELCGKPEFIYFKTACDMMIFLTVLVQYIFLCIILMCISYRHMVMLSA